MSLSSVGDELTPPDLSVLDPKDLHSNAALLLTLAVLVSLSSVSFECLFQFPKLGTTASWLCCLSSQPDLLWLAGLFSRLLTQLLPSSGLGLLFQEANAARIGGISCPFCHGLKYS